MPPPDGGKGGILRPPPQRVGGRPKAARPPFVDSLVDGCVEAVEAADAADAARTAKIIKASVLSPLTPLPPAGNPGFVKKTTNFHPKPPFSIFLGHFSKIISPLRGAPLVEHLIFLPKIPNIVFFAIGA